MMITTKGRSPADSAAISVAIDPEQTLAVLAEARRMQADVLGQLAMGLFTSPGKAVSAIAGLLRQPTNADERPNYS